jgi:hypothetical protein
VRKSREELIETRVGVRGVVRESKKRFASWGDGGSKVKWGESELGFERLGGEGGEKVLGGGSGVLGNAGKGVRGDGKGAAGEKLRKFGHGVDGRSSRKFAVGVVGGKDITPASIGKNSKKGDLRELLGDTVGATNRKDGAGPVSRHS